MDLSDRHILITGAARRVGRAIAERLMDYPIRLSAHYHQSEAEAVALGEAASARGREFHRIAADLRSVAQIRSAVTSAEARFGPVDILVNSAAAFFPTSALECREEEWDELLDVNLKGQFFFAQACANGMQGRGGVILNIGDVNGERPMRRFTPYLCAKAGLLMMTRALALEWAPKVRVNSVSPGAVLLPESYTPSQRARSIERTLLKRLGSPADVSEAVLFLIQNDYITGFDLKVDGGRILTARSS